MTGTRLTRLVFPDLTSGQQELLRWVAITTMVIDHAALALLEPDASLPLRAIGRLAWPLFAYLMAYNVARRGVNPRRYLLPLLIACAVSVVPYWLAFGLWRVNILGTLFLAAAAITLLRADSPVHGAPRHLAFALVLAASPFVEYGPPGVLLAPTLWWVMRTTSPLPLLLVAPLVALQNFPWVVWPAGLAALPLPALAARLRASVPRSGRLPWLFYPTHLLAIALIAHLT